MVSSSSYLHQCLLTVYDVHSTVICLLNKSTVFYLWLFLVICFDLLLIIQWYKCIFVFLNKFLIHISNYPSSIKNSKSKFVKPCTIVMETHEVIFSSSQIISTTLKPFLVMRLESTRLVNRQIKLEYIYKYNYIEIGIKLCLTFVTVSHLFNH